MDKYSKPISNNSSNKEKINLLRELRDEGILTTTEYDKKVDELLQNAEHLEQNYDVDKILNSIKTYEYEITNTEQDYDVDSVINSIKYYSSNRKNSGTISGGSEKNNKIVNWGFFLGITSIFFGSEIGIIPLLAAALSLYGIIHLENDNKKYKKRAIIGIVLGILYFASNLYYYRYI